MNKLDKKQIPQFAALCVLSAGVFGYFVLKIVTPSPAAAGTRPHPASEVLQASAASPAPAKQAGTGPVGAGKAGAIPDAAPSGDEAEVPAPTPGMRDPFVVGYVDPATVPAPAAPAPKPASATVSAKAIGPAKAAATQMASIHEVAPASVVTSALPFGLKGFPAPGGIPGLPDAPKKAAPPAAPAWTVTGVLQGGTGQVAVLRSGEERRIVRIGDSVDGLYRVVTVTRSAVVLRHGTTFYHLALGAAKPAGTAPAPPLPALPALSPASVPAPTSPPLGKPQEDALAPVARPAGLEPVNLEAGLARMVQGALLMARAYMTPAQAQTDTYLASSQAPIQENAQAPLAPTPLNQTPLDLSRDIYGSGQAAGGAAQWRCVLAVADLGVSEGAETLPVRFI